MSVYQMCLCDSLESRGCLNTVYLLSRMYVRIDPPVGMYHLSIDPPVSVFHLSIDPPVGVSHLGIAPPMDLNLLYHNQSICHS